MKRAISYLVLLLISLSLVTAVGVSTDKTDYTRGEVVNVTISSCIGTSITKFKNPSGTLADIKSGQGNWSAAYHTSSDASSGKYTVSASCSNGEAEAHFCVDAPGCLEAACVPDWDCSEWGTCVAGVEERTCADKNNCEVDKEETRACSAACQESWTCLSWSNCVNGIQTRSCFDQNNCGTALSKPPMQQSCQDLTAQEKTAVVEPPVEKGSFLSENLGLVVAVGLAAVLLVAGLLYYFKWKGKEASFDEVREWIRSEREKETSDEDIRISLQKRGWEEKDIKAAMKKGK